MSSCLKPIRANRRRQAGTIEGVLERISAGAHNPHPHPPLSDHGGGRPRCGVRRRNMTATPVAHHRSGRAVCLPSVPCHGASGWRVLQAVLPPARDRLLGRFMGVFNAPVIAAAPTCNFPACQPQRRAKAAMSGIGLEAFGTTTAWARLPTRHGGELSARQSRGLGVNVGAKR